jgi:hypothetical protein
MRFLARSFPSSNLYGKAMGAFVSAEVDQWLMFALKELDQSSPLETALKTLNQHLQLRTFMLDSYLTMADFAIWSKLKSKTLISRKQLMKLCKRKK